MYKSVMGILSPRWTVSGKLNRLIHDAYGASCARFGPQLRILSDAPAIVERISIRPPSRTVWENVLERIYYGLDSSRAVVEHPEVWLYRLKEVFITGSESLMFSEPHTLLRFDASQSQIEGRKIRRPIPWLARGLKGSAFPMGGRGTGNRGHFLCEHLPRLLLAREWLGASFPLKVLLTPGHATWQTEYLVRLGEDPSSLVEGSRGTVFCPEAWYVPNLSSGFAADLYEPEVYREIARRLKAGLTSRRVDRQLFITRKDAPSRRLSNEDEVFTVFRRVYPHLERLSLSGKTLEQQIALFAEAGLVVGAHSQAFRNLLYCEGTLAIQLVSGTRTADNEYLPWASNYERLGVLHGNRCLSLYSGQKYRGGDWEFPLGELRRAIDRLEAFRRVQNAQA